MSTCIYDSNKLIPAPFVSITKNYQTTPDGTKLSALYQITITGKILADKGSPYKDTGDGQFKFWITTGYPPDNTVVHDERLGYLIRKREKIERLFSVDGRSLEWQSADGSAPMKCNPRVLSIQWSEGPWFNYIDFTINLEADVVYANGELLGTDDLDTSISEASETWSVEAVEEPENAFIPITYRVSHTASATGKRFYDDVGSVTPAFNAARSYVLGLMGYDANSASGFVNPPDYFREVNHVVSQNYDELAGSFSATETWILASGIARTDYTISSRKSLDSPFYTIGIEGNITGFRDTNHPYTNALTTYTAESGLAYGRAQSILTTLDAGLTLNTLPLSDSAGFNPVTGTINYSYEFDNRPSNRFSKARSETVTINRDLYANPPAIIPVLGRTEGPVLQNLYTKKEYRIGLSVELVRHREGSAQFSPSDSPAVAEPYKTELLNLIDSIQPSTLYNAVSEFVENQTDNFDMNSGRYSYNISWVYEV